MSATENRTQYTELDTSRIPSKARVAQNDLFPDSAACDIATTDHNEICVGIQRSGPTFLETSWEGNSAKRKQIRKIVFPVLYSTICQLLSLW